MDENPPPLNPDQTALLLMDYQPAVLGAFEESQRSTIVDNATRALSWARSRRVKVAHVRVALTPADHAAVPSRNRTFSRVSEAGMLVDGSPECEIIDSLKPDPADLVVRKVRYGSFSTTDLGPQLHHAGVDTLVLGGVTTAGVVLSTVRDAADQDFQLYVMADACGDSNPTVHSALMDHVFPHQAYVIAAAQLTDLT